MYLQFAFDAWVHAEKLSLRSMMKEDFCAELIDL